MILGLAAIFSWVDIEKILSLEMPLFAGLYRN
jgi:hypothetical protein